MPVPALKSLVEKSDKGKSLKDAERYWDEAKEQAKKQGLPEGKPSFYQYVMGIVKKRLGLASEDNRFSKVAAYLKQAATAYDHEGSKINVGKKYFLWTDKNSMRPPLVTVVKVLSEKSMIVKDNKGRERETNPKLYYEWTWV